jgi:hypothetical protein
MLFTHILYQTRFQFDKKTNVRIKRFKFFNDFRLLRNRNINLN